MNLRSVVVMSLVVAIGCTTNGNKSKDEKSTTAAARDDVGKDSEPAEFEVFDFPQTEGKRVYQAMLAAENQAGVAVPADQVHSTQGQVSCHRDGSVTSCYFRTRLGKENNLNTRESIERSVAVSIWEFYLRLRPDLKNETIISGDLLCDFLGKKSPPFDVESINCKILYPRLSNEAIIVGAAAENLALTLAEDLPLKTGKAVVAGSILCQWIKGSERTPCVVRPMVKGVLREKFIEIPAAYSAHIGPKLMQTLRDDISYRNGTKSDKVVLPAEIMGSAKCSVDSSNYAANGRRSVVCRLAI